MVFLVIFAGLFLALWGLFTIVARPLEHALNFLANRLARFRYTDYLPVVILVVVGFGVSALAADAFEDLAELVHGQSPLLSQVDTKAHQWASNHRSLGATAFFTAFSFVGGPVFLAVVVAIVAIVLLVQRRFRWAAYLVLTTGLGSLLVTQLKLYFARARPDLTVALRHAKGYSFPSGHAMGSTIVAGALTYLAFRICRTWRSKAAALAAGATFIAAVAFSRVYLGVHWISDIAAGLTAGLVWVITATIAYEATRRIRLIRELRRRAKTLETP
jgi:membrane-associated phospholipid phosphatase